MVGYRLAFLRGRPIADSRFHLPAKTDIDAAVVAGPAVFGIGWGLSGYCPGPAVAALSLGAPATLAFVAAMIVGMAVTRLLPAAQLAAEAD
jgi:uncharacterized membrane protein YedE/YeeE